MIPFGSTARTVFKRLIRLHAVAHAHAFRQRTYCQPNSLKFRLTRLPICALPSAAASLSGPSFHFTRSSLSA